MANAKFNEGRNALALKLVNLDTDTLTLVALSGTYVFDATDAYADLTGVLDTTTLTTTAVSATGWLSSDAAVFTGLAVGEDAEALVLRDTTASVILAFYDTLAGDQPLLIEGDGTNVTVNAPASGWYRV